MTSTTIRDIAKASGLSIGTVSRGLRNQAGLSEDTRQVVRDTAVRLGYDFKLDNEPVPGFSATDTATTAALVLQLGTKTVP